ncbi:MAG: aminotransferase class I/II-fold pyridoxal phosphate-dependent enzyme, partial [Candidatus Syntrophonatronum acetioxidans]
MKKADRIEQLPPYLFAEIDKKIREAVNKGVDVIKLGIGDPDRPTPQYIIDRMVEEVALPRNHGYPPDEGLPEFREAVSRYYSRRFKVDLDPDREVVPLIGSKEGIAHISSCFVNPGDINLVPDPGYPVYPIGTLFAGGEAYRMPLLEKNDFLPALEEISDQVASKVRLMFLNYPNNPTGAVASEEFFKKAVNFAKDHDIIICHDGAYLDIAFD